METNRFASASLFVIVVFISGVVMRLAKPVLFPFFLAIFLSFVLSPVLDFSTRLKIPKVVSIIFILILTFFTIYLMGALIYSNGKSFAAAFPQTYGQKLNSILRAIQNLLQLSNLKWQPTDWFDQLNPDKIGGILLSSLGPFFTFLSNLFLIFVFLVFILAGRGQTKTKIKKSFADDRASKIIEVIGNIDSQVQKYLAIKTIISLINGVLATAVMLAFGLDFAILFGFLTFLLNYIPSIGSIIATALPVIIAVFQFETLWPAFWLLVILTAIQMILSNLIEPRLVGGSLGLSPLVVLFFLFFWGWLWGIPGMILAVPIAAVIKIICSNIPQLRFVALLMSKY